MIDEERLAKAIEAAKDFPAATGRYFDPNTEDLYEWAMKQSETIPEGKLDPKYWSAWFAAREISMILLIFLSDHMGEEVTPEMYEEMRVICAEVAYD